MGWRPGESTPAKRAAQAAERKVAPLYRTPITPGDITKVQIMEMITEVARELGMRRSKYPEWVAKGIMRHDVAARQMTAMEAVLALLKEVKEAREAFQQPELPTEGKK